MPVGLVESQELAAKADEKFYSLLTVLLALVLFFAAISGRGKSAWASWFLLGLGAAVGIAGAIILATFPVLI